MRIGTIEARPGGKAFGFLTVTETRGRFPVHVPLHIVAGREDGPVLLVQAGLSGLEIEPAMILPHVVDQLDPVEMAGTLLLVPLLNTSGFEFEQRNAVWDDKDLNSLGRGDPLGTVSEQLIHSYFQQVVSRADAIIDIHTGARWGYFRYAGVYRTGDIEASKGLAVALGLPQVVIGQPEDASMAYEAAKDGKAVVSAWIGGGPGLRDFRAEDMKRVQNAVLSALRHVGVWSGEVEGNPDRVSVIDAHTVLRPTGERGLTFIDRRLRGTRLAAGQKIGYVLHPFTGDLLQEITVPRDGIMVHGGAAWPVVPEGAILAIIGNGVQEME